MKNKNAKELQLSGIVPNKKLNRWEVWYNGRLLMSDKNRVNCIWYAKYSKLV